MNSVLELEALPVEYTRSYGWKLCGSTIVICGVTGAG
ncbi:hypothetical protein J2T50_000043 [Streptococcus gallinaceus]|uniref:Uncharacterized protein n=1 Tax=Streptococcus gallinaceus TaxID=165758 RepID=A0ABV2JHV6_9STRE|nr:hypothetical protein [Streptococcus gallinaceus]MCP1769563.1 hypothetical protein [Streptococcus gallinaceus]